MAIDLCNFVKKQKTIKLGGKDFTFTELTIGDLAKFRAYLVDKRDVDAQKKTASIIEQAKAIGGEFNPMELLKFATKPLTDDEVESEMMSVDGLTYLAFLSLQNSHPGITLEQVGSIIKLDDLPEITSVMFQKTIEDEPKKKRKRQPIKKK